MMRRNGRRRSTYQWIQFFASDAIYNEKMLYLNREIRCCFAGRGNVIELFLVKLKPDDVDDDRRRCQPRASLVDLTCLLVCLFCLRGFHPTSSLQLMNLTTFSVIRNLSRLT